VRQLFLPGFPEGMKTIGTGVGMLEKDGQVIYLVGSDNYFSHPSEDAAGRRFALTSLVANRHVKAAELERNLGIPHRTLMNWLGQYRRRGPGSFYQVARPTKPRIMTADKGAECARLLAEGKKPAQVARRVGVRESTLRKAMARDAVPKLPASEGTTPRGGSSKSERSRADAAAAEGMGTACTRADERIEAAMGLATSATTRFETAHDVTMAGVLAGLPALCANGLLSGLSQHLNLPKGFYSALHILLVLGFMALARIRRPEGLRQVPPGEFGKVIGLDRAPEVRTLREKIRLMAQTGNPSGWMKELSKTWMEDDPEAAGYLYVDGHVRVYHGSEANLPRRYVSRERLCLRGSSRLRGASPTDYWVNDALGRPFFVVSKAVTSGLADTLLHDIVPQLIESVPGQPTADELAADPGLHRLVIVFDREGATHSLMQALWTQRIGTLTYRKNVKDCWPESEFTAHEMVLPTGDTTSMRLAKRETELGKGEPRLAVTEVRRLTPSGHQTAIITTARRLGTEAIAGRMFARWCQENFFAYMMEHYDIDGLLEYGTEPIPGTVEIVNPAWRSLDKAVRQTRMKLTQLQARLAQSALNDGSDMQQKSDSLEALQTIQTELDTLRAQRKATPRKVTLDRLPESERPSQLKPLTKALADTVKMIAYRAETAMVTLLRRHLTKEDDARALIRELFVSAGDIEPNDRANTLTIRIHRMASPVHDRAVAALLEDINQQEFQHPETGAKMTFALV